jgi:hypothetical protein
MRRSINILLSFAVGYYGTALYLYGENHVKLVSDSKVMFTLVIVALILNVFDLISEKNER